MTSRLHPGRSRLAETTGRVFDLQKFSLYDGPGIRTTVFVAGCPLRCAWCHNPEGLGQLDSEPDAELWTAAAVVRAVLRDRLFYAGGGGMTLSGGEPLLNLPFALAVLSLARDSGVHTCVQSSAFVPRAHIDAVIDVADLIYVDLKHMDSAAHRAFTGVPNERILSNVEYALGRGAPIEPRFPLIAGINDQAQNLIAMAAFLRANGCDSLRIVPYRNYYLAKPQTQPYPELPQLLHSCTSAQVERARTVLAEHGLTTVVDACDANERAEPVVGSTCVQGVQSC